MRTITVDIPISVPVITHSEIARIIGGPPGTRTFELHDGSPYPVVCGDHFWNPEDHLHARRIGRRWARFNDLHWENDLAGVFVSTDGYPGMHLIANTRQAQDFQGSVMLTPKSFLLVHFDMRD